MTTLVHRIALSAGSAAAIAALGACHSGDTQASPAASSSAPPVASASSGAAPGASTPWTVTSSSFPVPRASVDLVLNPQGLPDYSGPTGSVEGTITVKGPQAPLKTVDVTQCPAALDTYGTLFREGTPLTPGGPRPLADAVVVVVGYHGYTLKDRAEVVPITIGTNCAYPARTIAITYGQRIDVSNKTRALFAPYIDDTSFVAVMVAPPRESGEPVKLYPGKAGHFLLKDQMAPFVREDLFVFRHPLHAVSDVNGHYRIDGIPVGTQLRVGAYHPTLDSDASTTVDVVADTVKKVDLTLTYKPAPPPAKLKTDGGAPLPVWKMPND